MKACLLMVMNLDCFVNYFEPTYITKEDGLSGYHHSPDTWAAYIYLSKDLSVNDIRGKFLCLVFFVDPFDCPCL